MKHPAQSTENFELSQASQAIQRSAQESTVLGNIADKDAFLAAVEAFYTVRNIIAALDKVELDANKIRT